MQIRTGTRDGITRLVIELGETVEISFCPRVRAPQETLGLTIGTREFLKGEMSLTVTMTSEDTYEKDYSDSLNNDYLGYLITSNSTEGKRFCGTEHLGQDSEISDILADALTLVQARISKMKRHTGDPGVGNDTSRDRKLRDPHCRLQWGQSYREHIR